MKLYRTYISGPSLSRKIPKIEHTNVHLSRGKCFHSLFGWSTQSRNSWGHRHHVSYANELSAGFLCFMFYIMLYIDLNLLIGTQNCKTTKTCH